MPKLRGSRKQKAKRRDVKVAEAVEIEPDAWERFERAVGVLAHTPPKPRIKPKPKPEKTQSE